MHDETDPVNPDALGGAQPEDATHRIGNGVMQRMLATDATPGEQAGEQSGESIGRYRLIEKLGEGGFGAVWRAEQSEPIKREVALKLIKAGMDSAEIIARFEAERQALALMEHPNIAGVLDAGTTENGRPFFVMELVRGEPITKFADARKLSIRERLELFIPVCHAVQHAHQKAILHRDLKPGNILVSEVDGKPVPKVIDFGIAKALGTGGTGGAKEDALRESLHLTHTGSFIGTPRYMSPEQAGAKADLDTRSDIYTLGVILFELLTGDTPLGAATLRSAAFDEMLRMIRESEAPRPSSRVGTASDDTRTAATTRGTEPGKLTRTLRGDLDWISLRALEKDRERRYGSAAALAADIARHLASEPVEAGPPSALYRFRKLVRRNRLAFASASAILLLLVGGITASTLQMLRARRAEDLATLRLTQIAAEMKRADNEAAVAKAVSEFLRRDVLAQADPGTQADSGDAPNPNLTVREALDRAAEKIGGRFRDQPLVEATIRDTIGVSYSRLGLADSALPQLLRALELSTQFQGPVHPETLGSRNNRALVLAAQHKLAEAEAEHRALLEIRTRTQGPEHPDTLSARNNLALALRAQHKYAEAEAEHRLNLDLRSRVFGPDAPDTLATRNSLALLLLDRNRLAEAEAEFRAMLPLWVKTSGPEHPDTLMCRSNLAHALRRLGRHSEAEAEHRTVLEIRLRILGPDHLDTLNSRKGLAVALAARHRPAEAVGELLTVIEAETRLIGPEHPDTLASRQDLAGLLTDSGSHAEAEREFRALIPVMERVLGPAAHTTLGARMNLANCLERQKKLPEAEAEHRAVLAEAERSLGPEHPQVLAECYNLALTLHRQGKRGEAFTLARRVLSGRQKVLGEDHPATRDAREFVAELSEK